MLCAQRDYRQAVDRAVRDSGDPEPQVTGSGVRAMGGRGLTPHAARTCLPRPMASGRAGPAPVVGPDSGGAEAGMLCWHLSCF